MAIVKEFLPFLFSSRVSITFGKPIATSDVSTIRLASCLKWFKVAYIRRVKTGGADFEKGLTQMKTAVEKP